MMNIAITGNYASGKNTVASLFKDILKSENIAIFDADVIAKKVLIEEKERIISIFGREVLLENGELDRKKIREIVFYNPSLLKKLEDIVHPKTLLEIRNLIGSPVASIQLFLIPLLFEKGIESWFDFVITVYCSKDVIIKRATIRDNVNPKEVEAILKNQLPYEKKIARSHFVIDNSYEISSTKKQIEEILRKLSLL